MPRGDFPWIPKQNNNKRDSIMWAIPTHFSFCLLIYQSRSLDHFKMISKYRTALCIHDDLLRLPKQPNRAGISCLLKKKKKKKKKGQSNKWNLENSEWNCYNPETYKKKKKKKERKRIDTDNYVIEFQRPFLKMHE